MTPLTESQLAKFEKLEAEATRFDIEFEDIDQVRITTAQLHLLQWSVRHAKALIAEVRGLRAIAEASNHLMQLVEGCPAWLDALAVLNKAINTYFKEQADG